MGYNPYHFSFGRVKTNRKCTVLSTLMVCALPVVLVVEMFFWSWFFKLPCFFKGKYEKKKLKKVRTTFFWWHCQVWNANMNMFIYLRFNHFNQTINYEEDVANLRGLLLSLQAPIQQNCQTYSNNSSAISRRIVWVRLTILWYWRLKGYMRKFIPVSRDGIFRWNKTGTKFFWKLLKFSQWNNFVFQR